MLLVSVLVVDYIYRERSATGGGLRREFLEHFEDVLIRITSIGNPPV